MQYNQPFDQPSNPNAPYVNGNPSAGIQGSIVPAAAVEYPQREIVQIINDAGLSAPSNGDLTQLSAAVRFMRAQYLLDQGFANNIIINPNPAPPKWEAPFTFIVQVIAANTSTSVTCKLNATGQVAPVIRRDAKQLQVNDLAPGAAYLCCCDGVNVRVLSPVPSDQNKLSASQDYYVDGANGNDTNDGLTATVGGGHGPFATIQKAVDVSSTWNLNGFNISIHVADWVGHSYSRVTLPPINGSGYIYLYGNRVTPSNTTIDGGTQGSAVLVAGGIYIMDGFALNNSAPDTGIGPGACVFCYSSQGIYLSNIEYHAALGAHIYAYNGGKIGILNGIRVTGSVQNWHMMANSGANILGVSAGTPPLATAILGENVFGVAQSLSYPVLQIPGAISIPSAWACSINLGYMEPLYDSMTGASNVTGTKYSAGANGIIFVNGNGPNYLPGNQAGNTSNGGQYY